MTAVIHHGPPGSYKTFALVQRIVIPALQAGRVVVTNIRGLNNLDAIRSVAGDIPDSAAIYYLEPDTAGFDAMAKFFHWVPAGALIAMDEGQRVYPMRVKSFDSLDQPSDQLISDQHGEVLMNIETGQPVCRPATLEIAFDMHRHFNWDIYISTPNIGKIHSEIRKVVEWAYRHRNNSGLLPWYKNTWTEFRHDSEQNGKSISHYSGSPKRYKADSRIFGAYQSTATGTAKNTTENISIFRDPKLRMLFGLICCCVGYFAYNINSALDRMRGKAEAVSVSDVAMVGSPAVASDPENFRVSRGVDNRIDDPAVRPAPGPNLASSPFGESEIFYTGQFNDDLLLFEVEQPSRIVHVTSRDLRALGYSITGRSGGFVVLSYFGNRILAFNRQVTAPVLAGRSDYGAEVGQAGGVLSGPF